MLRDLSLPEAYLSSVAAKEANGIVVDANVDADYANSVDDRRSITGYVNFLAEGPITWQSKTQVAPGPVTNGGRVYGTCNRNPGGDLAAYGVR